MAMASPCLARKTFEGGSARVRGSFGFVWFSLGGLGRSCSLGVLCDLLGFLEGLVPCRVLTAGVWGRFFLRCMGFRMVAYFFYYLALVFSPGCLMCLFGDSGAFGVCILASTFCFEDVEGV